MSPLFGAKLQDVFRMMFSAPLTCRCLPQIKLPLAHASGNSLWKTNQFLLLLFNAFKYMCFLILYGFINCLSNIFSGCFSGCTKSLAKSQLFKMLWYNVALDMEYSNIFAINPRCFIINFYNHSIMCNDVFRKVFHLYIVPPV